MKEEEIIKSVVKYLFRKASLLPKALTQPGFYKLRGNTLEDCSRSEDKIVFGNSADIIANSIEKEDFFGYHVPKNFTRASDFLNAELIPLFPGYKVKEGGLIVGAVEPKQYLEKIKTPEGFRNILNSIENKDNLEKSLLNLF